MKLFKIFPATLTSDGQKVPLIKDWQNQATDNPTQIENWRRQFGARLSFFGIPTGTINGIYVLDVDVKKVNGFDSLKRLNKEIPTTMWQKTPSGGAHFFFKIDESRGTLHNITYQSSTNGLLGIDARGEGGWVACYHLENTQQMANIPEWMPVISSSRLYKLHENETKTLQKVQDLPNGSAFKISSALGHSILSGHLDAIRNAPQGESNSVLNTEAFKVGQLVKAEAFSYEFAAEELFKAAKDRGKPDYESRATIKSGLDGGLKNPIICPFPSAAPLPAFEIPSLPNERERWTPSYLTKQDLLNRSNLRKPQLFKDWATRDITITTADGGTGKTTLFLNEAIALALGDRFLGFDNKAQGKTLFITGEDTDKKLAAMLGEILRQMGLFEEGIDNEKKIQTILESIVIKKDSDLCLIAKDKQGFLVPNADAMKKLKEAVDDIKPLNIIIDPISSFWGSESALNDMNKAVTKIMAWLVEISGACVHAINHMGKSSSANKDMSQFAGRGGTGLPSNSRVSRVLRSLSPEEYKDATGSELVGDQSSMMCNVNKFSDGSPLLNKPFVIIREGYMFRRVTLTPQKEKEFEQHQSDNERVMKFIKEERESGKYPTAKFVIAKLANVTDPIPMTRIQRALTLLEYDGFGGERIAQIDNPNALSKDKAYVITDIDGKEL